MKIFIWILLFFISYSHTIAQDICLSGDCENGTGKLKCDCGYLFEGKFENGQKVHGTLTKEELVYTGDFKDDMAHGKGIIEFKDGSKYEGDFAFSQPEGKGIYYLTSGFVYTGEMRGGYFEGWGVKENKETGEMFAGTFSKDQLNGLGYWKSPNNEIRVGEFVDGVFTGFGAVFNDKEVIQCGAFRKGKLKTPCIDNMLKADGVELKLVNLDFGSTYSLIKTNQGYKIDLSNDEVEFSTNDAKISLKQIQSLNF